MVTLATLDGASLAALGPGLQARNPLGTLTALNQANLQARQQQAAGTRQAQLQGLLGQLGPGQQAAPVAGLPAIAGPPDPLAPQQLGAPSQGIAPAPAGVDRQQALAQLAVQFPQEFDQISTNLGLITQQQKDEAADFSFKLRNTPFEDRAGLIRDRTRTLRSQGRNASDTASLEQLGEEQQNAALEAVQVAALSPEKRIDLARVGARGLASAKTEILPGGTVIQALPSGEVQVVDPSGQVVTGDAREAAINASKEFQLELAKEKATISVDTETRKAAAKAGVELETEPEIKAAVAQAVDEVKTATKISGEERSNTIASNTYNAAMKGLVDSLAKTDTGPFVGLLPALTSDQQIAEGAIAAMGPVLKALFRQSGEGTFTDKDQEILTAMLPTRKDTPKARVAKLQNIDAIIRAKLTQPEIGQTPVLPARTEQPVRRIRFDAQGNIIQ